MKKIKENQNKRSISAASKDNKNKNIIKKEEKENKIEDNVNIKKGFHHKKRTSSYFLGSYLPNSNIFENNNNNNEFDINQNIIINNKNENIYNNEKEEIEQNGINNRLINNLIDAENLNDLNLSFPSYEGSNNNSMIIKKDEPSESNKKEKNNNNIILEMAKYSENSNKGFITLKNSLKYIKDKDERTTPSYQLALQADKKGEKGTYITTSNIIEEEKSSMMESKSELSTKKEFLLNDKKLDERDNLDKKAFEEFINNMKINNIRNDYYKKYENKNEMNLALNEIIIKNNKKEEDRKKILSQNKRNLLNNFFTMSNTLKLNEVKEYKIEEEKYKGEEKNDNLKKVSNYMLIKDKINNNVEFFSSKKRFVEKFIKKNINNKNLQNNNSIKNNELINNLINENNTETENTKKNINKIPHYYNMKKKFNQKTENIITSDETMNYKGLKTSNSNNSQISKKLNKIINKNESGIRSSLQTIKRRENLNNALSFIREKKRNKINSDVEKIKYYNNNTYNNSLGKKLTNVTYTNSLTNSNLNTNNSNTQSHSKSKEKSQHFLKKNNSGTFNNKGENIIQISDMNIEDNKIQTMICLKYKLLFNKVYEKIDVLEKANISSLPQKNFFVILCENKKNSNQFLFSGLFKYYKDKERFIKIYGDERNPNYIFLKEIALKKKFLIYEDNNNSIVNPSVNTFSITNRFKFTNNAIIFVKKIII